MTSARRTVTAAAVCLTMAAEPVLAQCSAPETLVDHRSLLTNIYYSITAFDADVKACIVRGFDLNAKQDGITSVEVPFPAGNVHVVVGQPLPFPQGNWLRNGTPSTGGTLTLPVNIRDTVTHGGVSWATACDRITKIVGHEIGHSQGLKHSSSGLMKGIVDDTPTVDEINAELDALPLELGPCDYNGIGHSRNFVGPIATGPSGPGPIGCGYDEWMDLNGCCHSLPLFFVTHVGHHNRKPAAHITSPPNNTAFVSGASVTFNTHVLDVDGGVYRVDWLANGVTVATSFSPPFSLNASNLAPGTYQVQSVAYDTAQQYGVSEPVTITVSPPPNAPQVLASGAILYAGQSRVSASGAYVLLYQGDGNLVLYGPQGAVIATMTFGAPGGTYMNPSGNLEVYNAGPQLAWQSFTAGNPGAYLWVRNEGRLAMVRTNGTIVAQWP